MLGPGHVPLRQMFVWQMFVVQECQPDASIIYKRVKGRMEVDVKPSETTNKSQVCWLQLGDLFRTFAMLAL